MGQLAVRVSDQGGFKLAVTPARPTAASPLPSLLQPFWVSQARAILFYSFSKTSAFVGKAKGHGFLVSR